MTQYKQRGFLPGEVTTAIKRLGHVSKRVSDDPTEIECTRCGADITGFIREMLKHGRLIAGVIPRCPGHRPLNYFVYRRQTVREMLQELLRRKAAS